MKVALFSFIGAWCASCQVTDEYPASGALFPTLVASTDSQQDARPIVEPVLYGRDGRPVGIPPQSESAGVELATGAPAGMQPGESGRMHILELYQRAIEEREQLQGEVQALLRDLEQQRVSTAHEQRRASELEAKLAALELERARVVEENIDLAGRLTTAQIRRLQAEKLLLEHKLGALEVRPEAAGTAGATGSAASQLPPAKAALPVAPAPAPAKSTAPSGAKP
jgi:hypothetical protein